MNRTVTSNRNPTPLPESYIVRIYRRDARHPARAAGTVEDVALGSEQAFHSLHELKQILARGLGTVPSS